MAFEPDAEGPPRSRFVPDEPAAPQGQRPTAVNAGVADFLAGTFGLPGDALRGLVNIPGMAFGTAAAAAGRPDLAPNIINVPGGGEFYRNLLRRTGVPGLSPDNPNPASASGTLAYDMTARGGFIPGGAIPAAVSIAAERTLGPQWAGVGAMTPAAVMQAYNAARAPALAAEQQRNAVRDATLKDARDSGYVVPPSQTGGGFMENRLESLAGKAAINQEAVIRNQQVTNNLARKAIGLPENAPITERALAARREEFSIPYQRVAAISPLAAQALQKLREYRNEATAHWRHYDISADPKAQKEAIQFGQKAETAERYLDSVARAYGKPELMNELRVARANIAKTYDIERALNLGDGNVDARVLGRALDKGKPLSGGLATAARFAEAFPQVARASAGSPPPGVSAMEPMGAAALGMGGYATMGLPGLAAGAIPFLRPAARSALLSDFYQSRFGQPNYGPAINTPSALQSILTGILAEQQ